MCENKKQIISDNGFLSIKWCKIVSAEMQGVPNISKHFISLKSNLKKTNHDNQ